MGFLLVWTLASAIIGFLGRGRKGGFWGFFFFSLILSPLLASLALLLAAPSKESIEASRLSHQREVARIAVTAGGVAGSSSLFRQPGFRQILGMWATSVLVFAALYWTVFSFEWNSVGQVLGLSVQIGTLGFNVVTPEDANPVLLGLLFAAQRLTTLTLIVLSVSRLVVSRQESLIHEVTQAGAKTIHALESLESKLDRQEQVIADIQVRTAATPSAPAEAQIAFAASPQPEDHHVQ